MLKLSFLFILLSKKEISKLFYQILDANDRANKLKKILMQNLIKKIKITIFLKNLKKNCSFIK